MTCIFTVGIFYTMEVFSGISASTGIGIGHAFVVTQTASKTIPHYSIEKEELDFEWNRLEKALDAVRVRINEKLAIADIQQSEILQTYLVMLDDAEFIKQIHTQFYETCQNIEFVVNAKATEMADMLRAVDDEYLAERATDITDVFSQVTDELLGYAQFDFESVPDNKIIVAESVSPADAVILFRKKIKGLVITEGGVSSHLAILSRNSGIPAVFGIENLSKKIFDGDMVVVNGSTGSVYVNPESSILQEFQQREQIELEEFQKLEQLRNKPAQTKDGRPLFIYANIGTPDDAQRALQEGADGIGLFRTEFLFMDSAKNAAKLGTSGTYSITEEVQFQAYRSVLEAMNEKPVTIRTLDSGGDKLIKNTDIPVLEEQNPLLGQRAIRLTLAYKSLFKRQLRALYRASIYGNLRIMIPLVTHLAQIKETMDLISEVKEELLEEGIPFNKDIPIGIMVETASAAVMADKFSKNVDFFSIGTNDLTQYVLGIDRENPAVAPLYDEKNIAVLRLIKYTVECAEKTGIPVTVCGEMAGNPETALILVGLGVTGLSMAPVRIGAVKAALANHTYAELKNLVESIMTAE